MSDFHQRLLYGQEGERRVGAWLQARGWYILPATDYTGPLGNRAPTLQGSTERLVLPDLAVAKKGLLMFAEVKAKADATYTRLSGTYDHGIGRRKCNQYLRCQQETGAHVWIFILEEKRQMLLFQSLDELRRDRRIYDGDAMDRGGMVFWPRERFDKIMLNALPGLFDIEIPPKFEDPPIAS